MGQKRMAQPTVYLCLLHFPIENRDGEEVVTAVTNLDVHDIARTARTYGIKAYYLVSPVGEQQAHVRKILAHWQSEPLVSANPDRSEALSLVRVAASFAEVRAEIAKECEAEPEVVLTDARELSGKVGYADFRERLASGSLARPVCLVFGTGWGVAKSFHQEADFVLAPLYGPTGKKGYNHLSVRAAVAGICDRLFGTSV